MNPEFAALVTSYRCTSDAAPTQYEGLLVDGRTFYFRYRFGSASLGAGGSVDEAAADPAATSVPYGDHPMDGCLEETEFQDLFVELLRRRRLSPV